MGQLEGKTALVTGGSRGLGLDIVRALAGEGATVSALARNAERLEQLKHEVAGVQIRVADVVDAETAAVALRDTRPDLLILNAGATPTMAPVHQQSWEQFSRTWNTDVHMTFAFGKELTSTHNSRCGVRTGSSRICGPMTNGFLKDSRVTAFAL